MKTYAENGYDTETQDHPDLLAEEMTLREYNYKIIEYYLQKYDHKVLTVAAKLQLGKSTIYRYLKEMEQYRRNQQAREVW